jgi:hypothetical protein
MVVFLSLLSLAAMCAPLRAQTEGEAERAITGITGVARVVSVGDVHGQAQSLMRILQSAQVLDSTGKWVGGKTHVVVTAGRADSSLADLLVRLQSQSEAAGGAVHVLVGPSAVVKIDDTLFVWDAWYRNESDLDSVLREQIARRVVVGHGDGERGINPHFHGKLIVADDVGHQGCLVIEYNKPFAMYHGHGIALPGDEGTDLARYRRQVAAVQAR